MVERRFIELEIEGGTGYVARGEGNRPTCRYISIAHCYASGKERGSSDLPAPLPRLVCISRKTDEHDLARDNDQENREDQRDARKDL